MNFIVSSTALLKELQSVSGVLNSSNTLPILDNFLFNIENKRLTISASDLESTMTTFLEVESKTNGNVAVPAKLLLDIIKALPEHPLTFSVDDKLSVEISSDYGKYKLSGFSADEFPKIPSIENTSSFRMSSEVLKRAIDKTIFACSTDEIRPVMCGIYFQLDAERLNVVTTDAHKLIRYSRTDIDNKEVADFVLPKKPMHLLKGILPNNVNDVNIEYNKSNVIFNFDNITLISRLVDGTYPNYEAIIPDENPNRLTVDRMLFSNAIRRVSIFANRSTYKTKLSINGSELLISAEDLDFANNADERLTCSYNGDDMDICFNSKFLLEMINNMDTENVVLTLSSPNRAGILLPETNEEGEDLLMLVMPLTVG
jgi:DNA polymerase III subunit beta